MSGANGIGRLNAINAIKSINTTGGMANNLLYGLLAIALLCMVFQTPPAEFASLDETLQPRRPTIFVSVASYRDSECSKTINELFRKATYPHRVFVGVCQQNSSDTSESCDGDHDPQFDKNIRTVTVPHTEAKGPCVARYICSRLYGGETYFMQIDSHTVMINGWDERCIEEIGKCAVPDRSILSMYPNDKDTYTESTTDVPVMCSAKFNASGLPTFTAGMKPATFLGGKPRLNAFMAAGFFFAPGDFVRLVPYDPSLAHLFQGEEILLSARAWTNGFDIYTPSQNVCMHHYLRHEKPKFWNDINKAEYESKKAASESRARRLLGLEEPILTNDRYGPGHVRSLMAFWQHTGIDPQTKLVTRSFCE